MARYPGRKFKEPGYDPLLAVHRITRVELTERLFEMPKDYGGSNEGFGVMKDAPFAVMADFRNWAAIYVSERIWSPDQKIIRRKDGSIRLKFTASSEVEVLSWVLSFGGECTLVHPNRLVGTLKHNIELMGKCYGETDLQECLSQNGTLNPIQTSKEGGDYVLKG
jgi:predicted DNA-binding transcriptional regulator YafY